jgi:hypothetical protein
MKIEKIADSKKYTENLHWLFCFLFNMFHINCVQHNLVTCASVIYEGYVRMEMELPKLNIFIKISQ